MTPRLLTEPDTRFLDVRWSAGMVHLYLNGAEVLTLSPAAAQWLATNTAVCATAAVELPGSSDRG